MVSVAMSCILSSRDNLYSILKEYHNDTNLQIMSVYLWDYGGEGRRGGGVQGIITRSFFESIVSETDRGNWLHVC